MPLDFIRPRDAECALEHVIASATAARQQQGASQLSTSTRRRDGRICRLWCALLDRGKPATLSPRSPQMRPLTEEHHGR
jgi:hypothetical protein